MITLLHNNKDQYLDKDKINEFEIECNLCKY